MTGLERIGPYEVVEQVGAGGMATVYKAYQRKLDRYVAIKLMHQNYAADAAFLARFQREARIVARLDHRAIVPVYDYDSHEGRPYLVMKFIEGRTLKEVMAERLLSLDEIRGMMGRVAAALTYAHEEGILHRDVKPSNIIIDGSGNAYLTDFGLARVALSAESTMSSDMMLGTPHYISPEQAQGQAGLDGRTDLYSLACVLYEQVTGRVPFTGDSAFAIIHKHLNAAPPLPSELNPELPPQIDAVFTRALAKVPAERFPTATALMQAFEEAVQATGLTQLDDNRLSVAVARAPQISEHTPGGGKYVSIPSPTGEAAQPASWDELLRQVSGRVKSVVEDVRTEIQQRDIVQDIAEGVRG
ncbi:MAG: serine/threonine-protein kinase, partial [Phototrophicaceae bacterium]